MQVLFENKIIKTFLYKVDSLWLTYIDIKINQSLDQLVIITICQVLIK